MKKIFDFRSRKKRDLREYEDERDFDEEEYDEDDELDEEDDFYEEDDFDEEEDSEEEFYEDDVYEDEIDEDSESYEEDDFNEKNEFYGEDDFIEENKSFEKPYFENVNESAGKKSSGARDYSDEDNSSDEEYYEDEIYSDDESNANIRYADESYQPDGYVQDNYEDEYYSDDENFADEDYQDEEYSDENYADDDYQDEEYPEDYEDDDYNENDDYPQDDESPLSKVAGFIARTSAVERVAAVFALLIVIAGISVTSFYFSAKGNRKQIEAFSEIGTSMNEGSIVGESGLIAVADSEKAKAAAAELVSSNVEEQEEKEEEEEPEVADDDASVVIKMTLTSIKNDMKVKFVNSQTKKLVSGLPLEIEVVTPDGATVTYNDHDQDGIIYKKDITAGNYKITPKKLPDGYEKYNLEIKTQTLTVKEKVEMKAVDVSNEVKKESQVNVAKEDTAVKTEVESKLTDTVEWVESTKTPVGESSDGNYTYEEVDKNTIADPSSSTMVGFNRLMFLALTAGDQSSNDNAGEGSGTSNESGSDNSGSSDSGNNASSDNSGKSGSSSDSGNSGSSSDSGNSGSSGNSSDSGNSGSSGNSSDAGNSGSSENSSDAGNSGSSGNSSDAGSSGSSGNGSDSGNTGNSGSSDGDKKDDKKGTISAEPSSIELKAGDTKKIEVKEPSKVSFKSDKTDIATVDDNGIVKAVAEGETVITISAEKYEDKKVTVKVTKAEVKEEKEIKLAIDKQNLKVGETARLTVTGPKEVAYKTSNDKVATVKDGVVTAVAKGTAEITVTSNEDGYKGKEAKVQVNVTENDSSKVPMSISKITLVEGQSVKLSSSDKNIAIKLTSSNNNIVTVSDNTITAKDAGDATITISAAGYSDNTVAVKVVGKGTALKDKNGNVIYVKKADGSFYEATYEDYYIRDKFYLKKVATAYRYTGWQTIDGKTYFFNKEGNFVTGEQVIQGAKYTFGSDGVLSKSSGVMGIDVSKWNGNIDWAAVKNSGIQYVIIRCGYRGSSQGALIEDAKFRSNIKGAANAGIKVGVYFFTQAVNEVEAVEEASMVINLIKGYNITYPVYLDVEASNGRGDQISAGQRTANIKAFCGTIQNAGYKAGVYANKTWFTSHINTSQITNYKIWLAQYAQAVTYSASRYDMWQYSSKGRVTGISGNVDMNICY